MPYSTEFADVKKSKSKVKWQRVYWTLLLLSVIAIVIRRYEFIWPGNLSYLDQGLLVFLGIIVVLPLVSELELFGVRVKRHIENATEALRQEIHQIQNVVTSSAAVGGNTYLFGNTQLPSEKIVDEMKQYVDSRLKTQEPSQNIES